MLVVVVVCERSFDIRLYIYSSKNNDALRCTGETDNHDYFDKVLSRKGAAPATGRDTLIKLQGRVARKLDTQDSENRPAGLTT